MDVIGGDDFINDIDKRHILDLIDEILIDVNNTYLDRRKTSKKSGPN